MMYKFIKSTDEKVESQNSAIKNLEIQMSQLETLMSGQIKGALPSNTEKNPNEHLKVISLRSGKTLDDPYADRQGTPQEVEQVNEGENKRDSELLKNKKIKKKKVQENELMTNPYSVPLPFPRKLKREKLDKHFSKFLEILKQLFINIPFTDALKQMPAYAKFLKEILSSKRKLEEVSLVKLTEKCSAILQNKLPQKLGDPGSFTIPCTLRGAHFEKALCDSGASINLMPFLIFRKLELGEMKDTSVSLQLADQNEYKDDKVITDSFERCLAKSGTTTDNDITIRKEAEILEKDSENEKVSLEEVQPKVELKTLPSHLKYIFLEPDFQYKQIPITPKDQEKTTFTLPRGTYAYRRMPFGLCNAPATFQSCMSAIFSNMTEKFLEIFMDDFTLFGKTFEDCFYHLTLVLKRCEETNLVLNWKKCHFMVTERIVLGHKISAKGIEVDKAKIDLIAGLPPPTTVKGIRSFLGHAGFYRRFIKDYSKISKPLTNLLMKDVKFEFSDNSRKAFEILKEHLTNAPIVISPDWSEPFEIKCDASDIAVGAILGQKRDKTFRPIYYANRTLNEAQKNYATTEKELLAVVFAFDKFRSYLIGTKVTVFTDHAALNYLLAKKDARPRLLRWILLLQEFDLEIKDRRGSENQVTDHLSRLKNPPTETTDIKEEFPDEYVYTITTIANQPPWFADITNYLVGGWIPKDLSYEQ
nr:uncharacterized protein LOC117275541 [Nicotiana tomentosiformis]